MARIYASCFVPAYFWMSDIRDQLLIVFLDRYFMRMAAYYEILESLANGVCYNNFRHLLEYRGMPMEQVGGQH